MKHTHPSSTARPRTNIRRVLALMFAVAALAACGTTEEVTDAKPGAKSAASELTGNGPATLWVRAADEPLDKKLVEAWNAANPKRQITMLTVPDAQYVQKFIQGVRSGDAPDLAVVDIANVKALTSQNLLTDLTDKIEALPYKDKLAPAAVEISSKDGKVYALPHQLDVSMLYYNKKLFTQAGLDASKGPANFEEITTAAQKITALGGGNYGFYFAGNCAGCNAYSMLPYLWASGGDIMNADGTEATLDDPAVAATLNLHKQLWEDKLMPPSAKDDNGATWLNNFMSGKIGMLAIGSFGVNVFKSQKGLDFGVTPIPGETGGTAAFLGGDVVGITKGAKNAKTAWDFIEWTMSDDVQNGIVAKNGTLTIRSDLADNEYTQAEPRLLTANKTVADAQVPVTTKYNSLFIDPTGPYLALIRGWVFDGNPEKATTKAKDGFASRLGS